MASRPMYSWIAMALGTLLSGAAPETVQAAPLLDFKYADAGPLAAQAAFRLSGSGRFGGTPRSFGVRPKAPSKQLLKRFPKGRGRTGASGSATAVFPGRGPKRQPPGTPAPGTAGVAATGTVGSVPRGPANGGNTGVPGTVGTTGGPPRNPPRGGPGFVIVPLIPVAGATVAILGAGGTPRPPIAPYYASTPGQNPGTVADALLDKKRHRPRELLAEVNKEAGEAIKQQLASEYGAEIAEVGFTEGTGVRLWHLTLGPERNLRQTLIALLQDRRVMSVQPNYIYTPVQGPPPAGEPSPAQDGEQVSPKVQGEPAGTGVKLAIIDTCVEGSHDEIKGSIASSFNALQQGASTCEPEDHGTAVASLIAGHGRLKGPAEGASLLAAQAFRFSAEDNEVDATTREIWTSMVWAAQEGAQVMNLSFAGPADPQVERAVAAAYSKGITLVAAAGNAGPSSPPLYPAAYPEVIAVTATDGRRGIYSAANRGRHISVSARGVDVLAAHTHNAYGLESGTSFAAAEVSGIVASILEKRRNAGPDEVRTALQTTAAAVPGAGKEEVGFGEADQRAAVAFAETSLK